MSDLRRWSEEGATPEELSLLEVARRRRASPAQRAAVLSALGAGVATTAAGAAGAVTKLVGVLLFASVGVGVALLHAGAGKPAAATASTTPSLATATATAVADPEPSATPPEPVALPRETVAPAVAKSSKPAPATSSSLSRELQVLKQAHDALARGNPNGALSALDDYHAHFPQGALGAEETVIRVQALLARGDRARAAAVAHRFSAAHPDSLYAQRVERLVSDVK